MLEGLLRRRRVVAISLTALAACNGPPADDASGYAWKSIAELEAEIAGGRSDARALAAAALARVALLDSGGPRINSVIELNPDAHEIAGALDASDAAERGLLHGIPVLVKANIDTGDSMATTAGSLALAGHIAPDDADLVRRLRDAGAVLVGKTNLSEWANFRSSRSVSGWSGVGGQTRNPHVLDRNPCGSSSGSGAAVAAGLVPLAVGTETDGSILCPAGANGIVGVKPTRGLVSQDGIVPLSWTQDTAGPMTRSVRDAALGLTVIAGPHPVHGPLDYTAGLRDDAAQGRRVGVWRGYIGAVDTPRVSGILAAALAALERVGAVVVDPVEIELPPGYREAERTVLLHEFKVGLGRYLDGSTPGSLGAVIEFNKRHADRAMPWFGQDLLVAAHARKAGDPAYESALRQGRTLAAAIDSTFAGHQLDALIAPTNAPAWPIDFVAGDRLTLESWSPAAISGRPSLTLPAGDVHGLPVGVSLTGVEWGDADLLAIAYALEQQLPAPKRPQFLPTLEVGVAQRP